MSQRTDEATEKRILALYALGYFAWDMAEMVGVSRQTIYTVLRRNGVTPNRKRTP